MKIFSTFTGIGGFEIGIHNAYRSTFGGIESDTATVDEEWKRLLTTERQNTSTKKGRTSERSADIFNERPLYVGYSEIDKYAISVYERHFPGVKNYGDITKINASELPDFDCLVGGFPCQAFSIAGRRAGFADTRGTLFFDLARILKEKQPRLFVFENVKGLLSHDKGRTLTTIIATIDELGYDCEWQVLNSKNHGVPQNRERIIIVGHLRGKPRPEVFPIGGDNPEDIGVSESKIVGTIDTGIAKNHRQSGATYIKVGTLRTHKDGNGFREVKSGLSPTIPARAREDGSGQPVITQDMKIRRLTPKECERLQAFPDDWTKYGQDARGVRVDISDTQRYKMCGNAVTTNVIRDVFERIFESEAANL